MGAAQCSHGYVDVQMLLPFIFEQLLCLHLPLHACNKLHFRLPIKILVALSEHCISHSVRFTNTLLSCTLLGYSFEPRPSSFALGSMGSVITIGLLINGCLHLKKPVWRERTRWSSPVVQAVATSKAWSNYLGKASFSSFHSRRQKEASARMVVRCTWNWIFKESMAHEAKQDT